MIWQGRGFGRNIWDRLQKISPVEFLIMVMIKEKPCYGYEIINSLSEKFKGFWEVKAGAIYPALSRLEERGLIQGTKEESDRGPIRKRYEITQLGEDALRNIAEKFDREIDFFQHFVGFVDDHLCSGFDKYAQRRTHFMAKRIEQMAKLAKDYATAFLPPEEILPMLRGLKTRLESELKSIDEAIKRLEKEPAKEPPKRIKVE
ncbi:MAG: PadR family transcriptional regulator [Candidatus Jordarchaeum sp.]|uniref:PadR family transcriptional regulator n=1 Tax=Candidatus Jordarchaeum sp. TaxID=2823881 RepID=UPI00404B6619